MILIVDPDVETASLIQAIVAEAFLMPTRTAPDGRLAWPLLQAGTVEFLILAVHLPPGNGPAFYAALRRMRGTLPPVLFITAWPELIGGAGTGGPVLIKPFSPADLIAAVEAAWPGAPPRRVGPFHADGLH